MPIVLTRIDQKLIHGQVLTAWVPFLRVNKIVVVDEETTKKPDIMRIMSSPVPSGIVTSFITPGHLKDELENCRKDGVLSLILFKDVNGAKEAINHVRDKIHSINLGYLGHNPDTVCLNIGKFFSVIEKEIDQLNWIIDQGITLYTQSVPNEPRVNIRSDKLVWPWP
ncbi:MAG: PTS sugar transporter subunit IIB [Deltaproteobacteria bacterium]|jgi:PTS system mannose-specific IIB component|nr:PTS sugar transporter subunit IIB [Deltaproteobacteria bacterium]